MQPDYHWQTKAEGAYTTADFAIDWDSRRATCPEGRPSASWTPAVEPGGTEIVDDQILHDRLPGVLRGALHALGPAVADGAAARGLRGVRGPRDRVSRRTRIEPSTPAAREIEGTISAGGAGLRVAGVRDTSVRLRHACSTWPRRRDRPGPRQRLADGEAAGGGPPDPLRQADDATTVGLTNSPAGSFDVLNRFSITGGGSSRASTRSISSPPTTTTPAP